MLCYTCCALRLIRLSAYRYATGILYIFLWSVYTTMYNGKFASPDVGNKTQATIVCSTISKSIGIKKSITSWLANEPLEIMIVTAPQNHEYMTDILHPLLSSKVQIIQSPFANKRVQLCIGFLKAKAPITVIADDDTTWSPTVLSALTKPFSHLKTLGAVFPEVQIAPSSGESYTLWEELAVLRLFGDAIDSRTSQILDGGVFCASGPTAAYRTCVLQEECFQRHFPAEKWWGIDSNAGDDQSLTRWMCAKGWDVAVLPDSYWGAPSLAQRVETHSRPDWTHVLQLLRWSRSNWQANIMSLLVERTIWR